MHSNVQWSSALDISSREEQWAATVFVHGDHIDHIHGLDINPRINIFDYSVTSYI